MLDATLAAHTASELPLDCTTQGAAVTELFSDFPRQISQLPELLISQTA